MSVLVLGWIRQTPIMKYPLPCACIWSSDSKDREKGLDFARRENKMVFELPDTPDVLDVARAKVIELHQLREQQKDL